MTEEPKLALDVRAAHGEGPIALADNEIIACPRECNTTERTSA
jgi:hypothetical protein